MWPGPKTTRAWSPPLLAKEKILLAPWENVFTETKAAASTPQSWLEASGKLGDLASAYKAAPVQPAPPRSALHLQEASSASAVHVAYVKTPYVHQGWVASLLYEKKARSQMYCQSCHSNVTLSFCHLEPVQIANILQKSVNLFPSYFFPAHATAACHGGHAGEPRDGGGRPQGLPSLPRRHTGSRRRAAPAKGSCSQRFRWSRIGCCSSSECPAPACWRAGEAGEALSAS